jgi:dihydropteroate synthase
MASLTSSTRKLQNLPEHPSNALIMGILNVTEDSFSDGGLWLDPIAAAGHAYEMARQGAVMIDIGAESTRPGALRVLEEVERQRVSSTIEAIHDRFESGESADSFVISVDTTRSAVAAAAIEAGASIVNDVSGGQLDPSLPKVVADADCLYVVQHWRGWLDGESASHYPTGVVHEVYEELMRQVDAVIAAGVDPEQIVIDPGFGFSKPGMETNMPLLEGLQRFCSTGYPVLVGLSRKRFVRQYTEEQLLQGQHGHVTPDDVDRASAGLSWEASQNGAWAVRVHNVGLTAEYFREQER